MSLRRRSRELPHLSQRFQGPGCGDPGELRPLLLPGLYPGVVQGEALLSGLLSEGPACAGLVLGLLCSAAGVGLGADSQPVLAPTCAAGSRAVGDAHRRGVRRGAFPAGQGP